MHRPSLTNDNWQSQGRLVGAVAAETEPIDRKRKTQQHGSLVCSCVQVQRNADFNSSAQNAKLLLVAVHQWQTGQSRGVVSKHQRRMWVTCSQVRNDDGEGLGGHQGVPVLLAAGSQVFQGLAQPLPHLAAHSPLLQHLGQGLNEARLQQPNTLYTHCFTSVIHPGFSDEHVTLTNICNPQQAQPLSSTFTVIFLRYTDTKQNAMMSPSSFLFNEHVPT